MVVLVEKYFPIFRVCSVIEKAVLSLMKMNYRVQWMKKVCIIVNLLIVELPMNDNNSNADTTNSVGGEHTIDISICIDETYNLIVCRDCGVGLPFEHVQSHFRNNHGITTTREQVTSCFNLENDVMTIAEAKDWIRSMWVGRAVQYISIIKGRRCNQ